MRARDLTTANTVAKISVVGNTAGGKKSAVRRSTGLDYSSTVYGMSAMEPWKEILPTIWRSV
jgi:hypothetical protein